MLIRKPSVFPLFFVLFYLVWTVRATFFYSAIDLSIPEEGMRLLFSNLVKILLWVLPAVVYIVWVDRRDPVEVMRLTSRSRATDFVRAGAVTLLYFVIVFLFEALVNHHTLLPLLRSNALAIFKVLLQVLVSPFAEELTFRGFVLPELQKQTGFWQANILQSLLFTAMHLPLWIWLNGLGAGLLIPSVSVFAIGLLLGWITYKTDSIWPAIGVHVLNNFLVAFLG